MPPIVSITATNSQQAAQAAQEAIALQNMGLQYERTGDFAGAERAFLRSLELKQLACAPDAATFGITHNSLGELYLAMGPARLGDADAQLQRAHAVREALAAQSVQHAFDAAVTRENLARVAECRGDREGARRMRKKGTMVCSNYNCPGQTFLKQDVKQCGQCKCAFYCSASCQAVDWKERHKHHCKKLLSKAT